MPYHDFVSFHDSPALWASPRLFHRLPLNYCTFFCTLEGRKEESKLQLPRYQLRAEMTKDRYRLHVAGKIEDKEGGAETRGDAGIESTPLSTTKVRPAPCYEDI